MNNHKVKALGLCSGGLDSILSALVLKKQGIVVEWVAFETPFFSSDNARIASKEADIPLTIKKVTNDYMKMLINPPAGYGKHMNPCMDCHAFMFKQAGEIMKEKGFDFLFSGEVVGQRPMSQTKPSLRYVEKHSGFDGHILRPLSAKILPETLMEKKGLVNRELLLDLSGRGRKKQIKLAAELKITNYPAPAGGCLLTDKKYSLKLKDLIENQKTYSEKELHLLKHGRHFRLENNAKVIVGRNQLDNENIIKYHNPKTDTVLNTIGYNGPITIITRNMKNETIMLSASICAGYSKAPKNIPVDVSVKNKHGSRIIQVLGMPPSSFKSLLL
ncbi:MAG: tRNA 4-thiouridine(8) synthase ThiI [Desulfobacteraceae bacterium]|jgi:tRNA-uridine 2-sulfurtransferase|nr:tRNA 4-thiouridine(8) synthase ThiI [Desulfobacteraceae bacterium]MBT4363882.1 tRNA 4-thiouridine(8) synthase ThiI [Desulfobacteraceae bacterium]